MVAQKSLQNVNNYSLFFNTIIVVSGTIRGIQGEFKSKPQLDSILLGC